jgi:hypothetical protein
MKEDIKEVMEELRLDKYLLTTEYCVKQKQNQDEVNHPSHYTFGNIEVIDAIEDWDLPYHLGNVVKYVARAGKKDKNKTIQDLKKAQWYLSRFIEMMESENDENK